MKDPFARYTVPLTREERLRVARSWGEGAYGDEQVSDPEAIITQAIEMFPGDLELQAEFCGGWACNWRGIT